VNGSAAWWWAQATNPSSPYYDPYLADCTTTAPCQYPITAIRGATYLDEIIQDYVSFIDDLSDGRLDPHLLDISFSTWWQNTLAALPDQSGMPFGFVSWGPDYPDPSDYMPAFFYPDTGYTSGEALAEGLDLWTCSENHGAPAGMPSADSSMAALLFWAHEAGVPQACQGDAYAAMNWGLTLAAHMALGPARVLLYNLAEHIANLLALYVYFEQVNEVGTYAAWIEPSSLNLNVMQWDEGLWAWYLVGGNGVLG